jgi:hypothetical protein
LDQVGSRNLQCLRAGLRPRRGETAINDFSVEHNLPIPVAGRTVSGDPVGICAFLSHDAQAQPRAAVGFILPKSSLVCLLAYRAIIFLRRAREISAGQSTPFVRQAPANRPPLLQMLFLWTGLLLLPRSAWPRPLSVGRRPHATTYKANARLDEGVPSVPLATKQYAWLQRKSPAWADGAESLTEEPSPRAYSMAATRKGKWEKPRIRSEAE